MDLQLAFWNAGMGKAVEPTIDGREENVTRVVRTLTQLLDGGAAIVGLCEVDGAILADVSSRLALSHSYVAVDEKVGRSRWDLAVVYREEQVRCTKGEAVATRDANRTIKAGYSFEIDILNTAQQFHLYLVHWPSRMSDTDRTLAQRAGEGLWHAVQRHLEADKAVMILGDFNDEPFDRAVQHALRATRDPYHALNDKETRLYNPSWWLCCPTATSPFEPFGSTSRYKGSFSHYHLLDQALVSAHFLDIETRRAPVCRLIQTETESYAPAKRMRHLPLGLYL